MNIIEAAKALSEGKRIRRSSWGKLQTPAQKSQYDFLQFGEEQTSLRAVKIEELLADDWEIHKEQSLAEKEWKDGASGDSSLTSAFEFFKAGFDAAEKHFTKNTIIIR